MDPLEELPPEVANDVFSYLHSYYNTQLTQVSKKWREKIPNIIGTKYINTSYLLRFNAAIKDNNLHLVKLLTQSYVPTYILNNALKEANDLNIIEYLINIGANSLNETLITATYKGNLDIIKILKNMSNKYNKSR